MSEQRTPSQTVSESAFRCARLGRTSPVSGVFGSLLDLDAIVSLSKGFSKAASKGHLQTGGGTAEGAQHYGTNHLDRMRLLDGRLTGWRDGR